MSCLQLKGKKIDAASGCHFLAEDQIVNSIRGAMESKKINLFVSWLMNGKVQAMIGGEGEASIGNMAVVLCLFNSHWTCGFCEMKNGLLRNTSMYFFDSKGGREGDTPEQTLVVDGISVTIPSTRGELRQVPPPVVAGWAEDRSIDIRVINTHRIQSLELACGAKDPGLMDGCGCYVTWAINVFLEKRSPSGAASSIESCLRRAADEFRKNGTCFIQSLQDVYVHGRRVGDVVDEAPARAGPAAQAPPGTMQGVAETHMVKDPGPVLTSAAVGGVFIHHWLLAILAGLVIGAIVFGVLTLLKKPMWLRGVAAGGTAVGVVILWRSGLFVKDRVHWFL